MGSSLKIGKKWRPPRGAIGILEILVVLGIASIFQKIFMGIGIFFNSQSWQVESGVRHVMLSKAFGSENFIYGLKIIYLYIKG